MPFRLFSSTSPYVPGGGSGLQAHIRAAQAAANEASKRASRNKPKSSTTTTSRTSASAVRNDPLVNRYRNYKPPAKPAKPTSGQVLANTATELQALASLFGPADGGAASIRSARERAMQRVSELDGEYRNQLGRLAGLFMTGEDPAARRRYEAARADLGNQLNAALPSIQMAYDRGRSDLRAGAQRATTSGQELGARYAQIANDAAAGIRANTADLAAQYAADYGVVGGGAASTSAADDILAGIAASGAADQALAEQLGQIYAETANLHADQMQGYAASEQTAARNATTMAQQQIYEQFLEQEAQRQAAERAARRDAELRLYELWQQQRANALANADSLELQAATAQDTTVRDMFLQSANQILQAQAAARLNGGAELDPTLPINRTQRDALGRLRSAGTIEIPTGEVDKANNPVMASFDGADAYTAIMSAYAAAATETDPDRREILFGQALAQSGLPAGARQHILKNYGVVTNPHLAR